MIRSPLVCPVSVGREAPLQALLERLDRAAAGDGSLVLVGGDAGIGKSRLIRELKNETAAREIRVIEGRCSSTESSVPYAPLMDALRFRIAKGEGEAAAQMLGPLRAILAPIFPQLDSRVTSATGKPGERERERPFDLISAVLERLASEESMLLVLEDVHWADQTSLELLHHLAHRAPSFRMLIVATYRSDDLHSGHPLRRLLGSLARDRVGEEMRILPLDREQTREMLQRMLDADPDPLFAAAIWRRSEGNPFFVEELISVLGADGQLKPDATSAQFLEKAPLPSTVSEAVLSRVSAVGPGALETLSAAAVLGRTFDFEDLRSILGMSELELLEILEELVAHQLLREEKVDRRDIYAFPHALMQEALYGSFISRRRRVLHRRAAIALEKRTTATRLDELAYHFRLGGDHERAWKYAKLAGDEAVRLRAWDDAAAHYENALASLDEMSDESERAAELLERLAGVAWRQSRAAPGRQYAEEALRLRRALGQTEATVRLLRRIAALQTEEGDTEAAGEALDEALQLLEGKSDSSQLGAIYDELGRLSLGRGDLDRAESLLTHGLSLASRDAQGAEEVLALVSLAELSVLAGQVSAGLSRLDVALALLLEETLPFPRLTRVYAEGVRILLLAQEYTRALEWAEAAQALCERQGIVGLDALFRAMRAVVLTITSGEEDTLTQAARAVDELRRTRRAELKDALRMLAFIHRARGDMGAARLAYEEAADLGERGRGIGLALVSLAEGKYFEAADVLDAALEAVPPSQPLIARQILPYTVEALIAVGRVADAVRHVGNAQELPDSRAATAQLDHAVGLLRLAQGRPHEARRALESATDAWEKIGNRLECRRASVALFEALLSAGQESEGLAFGRLLLEKLGRPLLPREREIVRRALRRAGVRTRPDNAAPAEDRTEKRLTTREEAVLREVAQGRTNREIAAALGIAEKTVSVHVSHILAKLGCKTRTQAARFAMH